MTVVDRSLMKTTILLLVSDSVVRSILKETLEREGYTVLATGDLGQAVDRLQECIPDLLITRTYIESLPGHEAAMYLLGGLLDNERLAYRAEQQGFEVFPKPYTAAVLLQEVRKVLNKPRG
jgi:CheY-like chemotaxis protein